MPTNPSCPCCGGSFCPNDFVCTLCGAPYDSFEFPPATMPARVVVDVVTLPRIAGLNNELWLMYSDEPLSDATLSEAVRTERPCHRWLATFRRIDGAPVRELTPTTPTYGAYRTRVLVVATPRVTSVRDVLEAHCVDMLSTLTSLTGDRNA